MSCIHILVSFIYVYYLNEISQCSKEDAFVFTECNATLVWNLGNDSSELLVYVTNPNGSSIIKMDNKNCTNRNNSSVKCTVEKRDIEVLVSVIIINTTINDSGNYTAWIRKGFSGMVPILKQLTVIDKPQIIVEGKPIIYESFLVMCSISFIHECLTFRWKIKGTDVEYASSDNASKLKFTNLTTMDSSIKLECQVGIEKCVDSNHAHHICVSAESDTHIVRPYYGPYNVFFNLTDNNIYLRENQTFMVKCYADCYPVCIFRWESYYMNVEDEELVVNRFESTKAGPYICIARNRETNATEKSRPIFLHHLKGHVDILYWIGPVFLVVVFVIFVTVWRIKASRGIEKRRKRQARAEQADNEVSRAKTWTNSRDLPCPPVQTDLFRRTNRLDYPKLQRHFRSSEKLSDQDKDVCNQKRDSMFLQTHHSSNILDRQIKDDFTKVKSTSEKDNLPYSIDDSPKGSWLLKQFARTKTSGTVTKDYHEPDTNSQPLISLQRSHDGSKLQEDPYHTIDENVLTVYDYSTFNAIEETSQETERRPAHRIYYYARSSVVDDVQEADVHATDESYLNPISDPAYALKTCQFDEKDMNGTDKKYITIIDDFSRPGEETNVTEADPTYITPIAGSHKRNGHRIVSLKKNTKKVNVMKGAPSMFVPTLRTYFAQNLITDMKFLRGKMGMLTILLLILMKGTDGPPVPPNTGPPVPPNTGPPVIVIKACAGEDQTLMTKDESAQEVIMTSDWIFSNIDATINGVTICIIQSPGNFSVDRLYSNKVEYCNTTSIILKNISLQDMGYYKVKFLKEKIQDTESLPIFLSVSDTPTKQCKPDIKILSGNMLNCSTQCEQFDVEWTQNKGDVVGNGSILQVDCLPKNESFSCCLKSKDMECYKGDKLDLCAPIPPSYCTENRPGENVPDVHADKVPDNSGSNMFGLLALLIIPVILVVICVLHRKKILPCPTMCRDKSIPCCSVSTQERHADDKNVQIPDESVPMLANGQKPDADDNDDQVP
ncbi:hypothetical protein ACJMK2_026362, partial [Sinanodonta woodiana]